MSIWKKNGKPILKTDQFNGIVYCLLEKDYASLQMAVTLAVSIIASVSKNSLSPIKIIFALGNSGPQIHLSIEKKK